MVDLSARTSIARDKGTRSYPDTDCTLEGHGIVGVKQ